jgi:hypothetical protein
MNCKSAEARTRAPVFRPHSTVDTVTILDTVYESNIETLEPVNNYYMCAKYWN